MSSKKRKLERRKDEIHEQLPEELRKIKIDPEISNLKDAVENIKQSLKERTEFQIIYNMLFNVYGNDHFIDCILIDMYVELKYDQSTRLQKMYNLYMHRKPQNTKYHIDEMSTTYAKIELSYKSLFKKHREFLSSEIEKEIKQHCFRQKFQSINNSMGLYYFYMMNELYCLSLENNTQELLFKLIKEHLLKGKNIDIEKIVVVMKEFLDEYENRDEYIYACTVEFIDEIIGKYKNTNEQMPEELYYAIFSLEEILSVTRNSVYNSQVTDVLLDQIAPSLNDVLDKYGDNSSARALKKVLSQVEGMSILTTDKTYDMDSDQELKVAKQFLHDFGNNASDDVPYKEHLRKRFLQEKKDVLSQNIQIKDFDRTYRRQTKMLKQLNDDTTFKDIRILMNNPTIRPVSPKHIKHSFLKFCNIVREVETSYHKDMYDTYAPLCVDIYVKAYLLCEYMKPRINMHEMHIKKLYEALVKILNSVITNVNGDEISIYTLINKNMHAGIEMLLDDLFYFVDVLTDGGAATVVIMDYLIDNIVNCRFELLACKEAEFDIENIIDKNTLKQLCTAMKTYTECCYSALSQWLNVRFELDTQTVKIFEYIKENKSLESFLSFYIV